MRKEIIPCHIVINQNKVGIIYRVRVNALLVACHFYALSKKNTLNLANAFSTALRLVYPCGTLISVRKY